MNSCQVNSVAMILIDLHIVPTVEYMPRTCDSVLSMVIMS